MTVKIALGGFPEYVSFDQTEQSQIKFFASHGLWRLYTMSKAELSRALAEFSDFNHVVFRLSGENPLEFIELLRLYGLLSTFRNRTYSASFWSMDSHHLGRQEARAAQYFDHVFVAHSEYMQLFDEKTSTHLPCAFSLASNSRIRQSLSSFQKESSWPPGNKSLTAPFAAYPRQGRNLGYLKGLWAAQELGISNFFGTVRGGTPPNEGLIQHILSHSVVLNLSLSNDLNMRNFEALALNRILLTNRVSDHEFLERYKQNIVFLKSDLSDLKEKISLALETEPRDISVDVLQKHSLWPRVQEIARVLLTQSGTTPPAVWRLSEFDKPENQLQTIEFVKNPHSAVFLLARAQGFSRVELMKAVKDGEFLIRSILEFVVTWLLSLVRSAGVRISLWFPHFRAVLRAIKACLPKQP